MSQNSNNQDYSNETDGFILGGGTTKRDLTVTGADITLTGSGTNTYTMPSSTDTLVGRASTDTLTNKTLTSPVVNTPTGIVKGDVGLGNVTNNAQYYPGGTDVAVADGGTGSSTTSGARTNLGVTDANYKNTNTTKSDVGLGNVDNTSDDTKQTAFLQAAYPVGAVYMSGVSTNPATLFGFGTWTRIEGKFVVGASDSDTDFDLNDTGGAKTVTLADSEVPATSTSNSGREWRSTNSKYDVGSFDSSPANFHLLISSGGSESGELSVDGGAGAHENLPPYIAKYLWERVS